MRTLGIIALVVVSAVVLTVLSVSLGWFGVGAETVSAQNVRDQFRDGYTKYESLTAIAANYCSAQTALNATTDPSERTQRITQVAAQEQNFNRVAASYNAAMADAFRAKFVKPADLPNTAPTFAEATAKAGC